MRLRRFFTKLALSLASLIVVLGVAEIAARLAEPGPFSLLDHSPYLPKPGMDHVTKPNFAGRWDGTWYATNSLGLRGGELEPSFAPDEYRVLCVGDSTTFGKGVNEEDCWPRQFERLLERELPAGAHALVANAGVNGYSAGQYAAVIQELAPKLRPNLIVVGYCLNDFPNQTKAIDESIHQGEGTARAAIGKGVRDFLGRFASFRWMRATYYVMHRARDFAEFEAMAKAVKHQGQGSPKRVAREIEHLEDMQRSAREMHAELCVFLFPYESQVYLEQFDSSGIDWLEGLCDERKIPFVTMIDEFRARARSTTPPKPLFLRGDRYHPNPEGYGIVAERVRDVVRAQGWLPKTQ